MKNPLYIVIFLLLAGAIQSPKTMGKATVIDGDTLLINGQKIRLFGIDALEYNQTCLHHGRKTKCGKTAKKVLESFT